MTRTGAVKPVDKEFGRVRLRLARAFLEAARREAALSEEGDPGNPIVSQVVLASIAYADALTAEFAGRVNERDHRAVVATLRDALGNKLPGPHEHRLGKILVEKNAAQYGNRIARLSDAKLMLRELEEFAAWAEKLLDARR